MTQYMFVLLFTLVILIGCNQSDSDSKAPSADNTPAVETEPKRAGKVVARVNGKPIYEDDLNGKNLEYLINEEIIYQDALRKGYGKQDLDKVRGYERKFMIMVAKQRILENAEPTKAISDEEIKNYYESNKDIYTHVGIHEISFPDSNLGSEIKDKAKSGEELQAIANSYPDLKITVSDIGYNRDMVRHFTTREVGSVSEVIQKPDGTFSVLKIVVIKDVPLNTAKGSINHLLKAKRKAQMFDSYAQKAAEENNMTIEIIEQDRRQ